MQRISWIFNGWENKEIFYGPFSQWKGPKGKSILQYVGRFLCLCSVRPGNPAVNFTITSTEKYLTLKGPSLEKAEKTDLDAPVLQKNFATVKATL